MGAPTHLSDDDAVAKMGHRFCGLLVVEVEGEVLGGVGAGAGAFLKVTSRTCRGGRLSDGQVMSVEGEKRDDGCLLEF
jgi:hypothetical protein